MLHREDYAGLVDERTLFYNAGGLDLKVGAEGVQLGGKHSNRS
jgi:hypothetical protein